MSKFLQYGGQAVIEGVMMRSPRHFAVACRKPDGSIVIQEEPVEKTFIGKIGWLQKPFLRGTFALLDAMALGSKALRFSANVQAEAIETGKTVDAAGGKSGRINDMVIVGTMIFSICAGIALFVALPTMLTQIVQKLIHVQNEKALNFIDGLIRIGIFLGYIALISRMENIRRVFQYHGAEHKAINTLESGDELTIDNCVAASRIHPRCGTSFIIVVLLAGILVHCLFPRPENYFVRAGFHIALIPLVAGLAYEAIRLAGKYRNSGMLTILLAPGLWTQRLTTREPDRSQVEVALASLRAVLARESEATEPAVEGMGAGQAVSQAS